MKVNEVSKRLFELIEDDFLKMGFKLNRSRKIFSRRQNGIKQEVALLFDKAPGGIVFSVSLYVTDSEIEDVFVGATGQRSNFHVGINLLDAKTYLETRNSTFDSTEERFFVDSVEKVSMAAEVLRDYLNQYVVQYFSECDSTAKIDTLLNMGPSELSIHHGLYPSRAAVGLIAAKLSGNPEFDALVKIYDQETLEARESFRHRFELVCKALIEK